MNFILPDFLIWIVFFSTSHGFCLQFPETHSNISDNHCEMHFSNQSDQSLFGKCLRCQLTHPVSSLILENNCSPVTNLSCVELFFNDTISMHSFGGQYSHIVNGLFHPRNATSTQLLNTLILNIAYDVLDELSYELFRPFDALPNRSYQVLSLSLTNRENRLTLRLNPDVAKISIPSLQVNIYCGTRGLYQYSYIPVIKDRPLHSELKCEIPPPRTESPPWEGRTSSIMSLSTTSTTPQNSSTSGRPVKHWQLRIFLISFFASIGSLLPCLLLVYCCYLWYRRRAEENSFLNDRRTSLTSSLNDSIHSYESFS